MAKPAKSRRQRNPMPSGKRKKFPSDPTVRHILENGLGAEVAKACGVTRQAIPQWRRVPAEGGKVLVVEKITGIPRHKIRPDIYPPPPEVPKVEQLGDGFPALSSVT